MKKLHPAYDHTYLQNLIDNSTGIINIPHGEYTISEPLVLHSNSHLRLSKNTRIRLADDACCWMLVNDGFFSGETNTCITVEGGIWDGNNAHQIRGKIFDDRPYYSGVVMRFRYVTDLTVKDVTIKDPESFAVQIKDADRFTVENITFDFNMLKPNMDGVHVQGPARNGVIRNIKGATNDDLVALNCDDGYDDGEKPIRTQGNIENIIIDGLFADNGYTGVRLLSCGSILRNVKINNVFGTYRFYGISFTHHDIFPGAPVWFDGIDIDGVYCSKHPQIPVPDERFVKGIDDFYGEGTHAWSIESNPIIWFAEGVECGSVSISNVHRTEECVTKAHTIQIDNNVVIDKLMLRNINQKFLNCDEVQLISNSGLVKKLCE